MLIRPFTTQVLAILEAAPALAARATENVEQVCLLVGRRLCERQRSLDTTRDLAYEVKTGACPVSQCEVAPEDKSDSDWEKKE
jgi:hypothetical protein